MPQSREIMVNVRRTARSVVQATDRKEAKHTGISAAMTQPEAEKYLGNLVPDSKLANLKQSLTDVFDRRGKRTGGYVFDAKPVIHASSGNQASSITLFWTENGEIATIFAMGEHIKGNANVTRYEITYFGQPDTEFDLNKKISI